MKFIKDLFTKKDTAVKIEEEVKEHKPLFNFEVGQLYILISNNKENLSVAEFMYHHQYPNFSLPVMKDVVTGELHTTMATNKVFTEKRLKALSKLDWDEVVVLNYFGTQSYDIDSAPTKEEYIDPMLNFENIMNAIRGNAK